MHATRAAVEEGILPGGGVALLRAGKALDKLKGENEDQRHGVEMVKKAISWPARQIAINAGEDGSAVVGKIQDNDTYAFGFDAHTGKFENLVSHGIIDPTKMVRTALQDAASIGLLITTEAMVVRNAEKVAGDTCHARGWHGRHGLLRAPQNHQALASGRGLGQLFEPLVVDVTVVLDLLGRGYHAQRKRLG